MKGTQPSECFPASYAEGRARFLDECARRGASVATHRHPLAGPDGAPLFLDVARFGSPAGPGARRVLFVLSGTHGIEGLCGSGIQTWLLRNGLVERASADVALVLAHAVNPWGFAWLRRVNEDNVDLNRNFIDHGAPHPENPDYDALHDALNLARLEPAAVAAGLERIRAFQTAHGAAATYRALSGGQYAHPRSLQYGGREPVWSNRALRAIVAREAAGAELAVGVDLHSGLGSRAVGLLFQTASQVSAEARLAAALWPDVLRAEPAGGTDAALVSGLLGPAFCATLRPLPSCCVVLEFGTREIVEVMLALQAEGWLHHHGDRDSEEGRAILQRMRDAFFVDEDDWKEKVCRRAQEVVNRALAGMTAPLEDLLS